jgi:hypothetical protein
VKMVKDFDENPKIEEKDQEKEEEEENQENVVIH